MAKAKCFLILLALVVIQLSFSACAIVPYYSHYNVKLDPQEPAQKLSGAYLASQDVQWRVDWRCRDSWQPDQETKFANPLDACPKTDNNFIGIAISGGGSRASVFSAAVLFELQRYGLLQQVDVISSVSGGSFTAAYYVLSGDDPLTSPPTIEGSARPRWDPGVVFPKLQKNLIAKWVRNSFWILHILRYWFTYYDRTDVMAWIVADTLYDTTWFRGRGFQFKDLNPQRPYLILNATNDTEGAEGTKVFCFTRECFDKIQSSIDYYPIAHAVMASAAFPAVFQSVTLKDYSKKEDWYVHLIDGGASDNLGITALEKIVKEKTDPHSRKLVIVIDAYKANYGKDPRDPNPRSLLDYYIDSNVIDAYQTLMDELRQGKTDGLQQWLGENNGKLIHLQFDDLEKGYPELFKTVTGIKTNLKIKKNEAACLKHAARILVQEKMEELHADPRWKDLIQFPPAEGYNLPPCKLNPKKQQDEMQGHVNKEGTEGE
jgi:NTE family protein